MGFSPEAVAELGQHFARTDVVGQMSPLRTYDTSVFGAKVDGVTDDTVAVQAAITAAANAGGVVYSPPGTSLINSGALSVSASGQVFQGAGRGVSILKTSATSQDLISVADGVNKLTFRDLTLQNTSTAGHIFNAAGSLNTSLWMNCQVTQNNPAKSIYNHGDAGYLDNLWLDCILTHNGATSVPSINIVTNVSGANANTWMRCQCNHVASGAATFFNIERDHASSLNYGNIFRDLTFEVCNGGIITLLSANSCSIENCHWYDATTSTADLIRIGAGSGGAASRQCTIRNYRRISGALGGGLNDIKFDTGGKAIACNIFDCNQSSGGGVTMDLSSNQRAVLVGCENATIANQHQSVILVDRGRVVCETVQVKTKAGAPADGDYNVTPADGSLGVDTTNSKLTAASAACGRV